MSLRQMICIFGVVVMGATASNMAVAQVAPPAAAPKPATLWSFLGIPQTYTSVRDNMSNRNGNRPNRERKPPLTRLADPENLKSPNPAIKKAAEIKKEEDLAKQKIKAVKYLTKIGCGCYNRDGSITDALLKALDDCTEEVRYETVKAITDAANGEACENCKNKSCCSEELSNKLYEMAYERDDTGCYLEPSERVRLAAAEALRACCPGSGGDGTYMTTEEPPTTDTPDPRFPGEKAGTIRPGIGEGPGGTTIPPPPPGATGLELPDSPPTPTPARDPNSTLFQDETGAVPTPAQKSSRRTAALYGGMPNVVQASITSERAREDVAFAAEQAEIAQPAAPRQIVAQPAARPQTTFEKFGPAIAASVDTRNNQATINFPNGDTVPVGSILRGYHSYAFTGKQAVGDFIVIQSTPGFAIIRAHGTTRLNKLMTGDDLVVLQ